MLKAKRFSWLSLLLILALVLVACGGDAEEPAEEAAPVEEEAAPTEEEAEASAEEEAEEPMEETEEMAEVAWDYMPGGFMEKALAGEYDGTQVTFDGPFADIDAVLFEESVAPFEEATGIDINYIGDKEFEGRIGIAVDGGNAPDIADFPQPGLLAGFASQGHIVDPTTWMSDEWLQQQYNPSWLDMAMVPGPDGEPMMGGTWYRFNGKSLVWYPKAKFEEAGYEVPETWEELLDLTQLIADDGDPAWCIGIESGAATGWAATDWTEEMMLRTTSLENYDAWVEGTLPFDSPEVRGAMEAWSEIWFNPDFVFGGTDGIVTTNFGDSPAGMFEDPPSCWMHKQGNFITGFFPEGVEPGVDWDFFYLPPIGEEYGKPFLVAGDLNGMFNDRPEVRAVMEFMTTPQSASGWLENGGALATHLTATPEMYGQDVERGIAALVAEATSFRFDASDLMPGEVGAGSFWSGMTDYVSGSADLDTILPEIDASWPAGVAGQVQEDAEEEPTEEAMSIAEIAVADGNFTTLVAALEAAGLVETLAGEGEFTVFAPTDDAFAALPEGTVESLLEDPEGALTSVLLYHVVDGAVPAETVVTLDSATTLQGDDVTITVTDDGVVLNDTVKVTATDIAASNGIIHVIDAVLIPPSGEESTEADMAEGEATYLDRALAGEFDGGQVDVLSVLVDADEVLFLESMAAFEEATGITVNHAGTKEFETQMSVRMDAGDPPDVAMVPQPGVLAAFVAEGSVPVDVRDFIPEADLQERYAQGWLDSATFPGPDGEPFMAGVWWKAANKDLVWYPKAVFDEAGYEVPTTWDELIELSDLIVSDGDSPWCMGIESGNATGWVATDWMERLMLRTAPPEDYDDWVAGELPFASDQVKNAAELMSQVWLTEGYVLGGRDQIVTEFIGDTPTHMFEDPPTCWLHTQASWIQGFFGEGLEPGVDYDFFYFPPVDPAYGEPVLMAGDVFTMLNDTPEARAFLEHLSTGASAEVMVRNGGGLSPHQDSSLDWYETDIDRRIAEILLNAETVRFDASDLMPGEVGAGTFWSSMVDYVSGTVDLDTALQEIDDSWPE